MEKIYTSYTKKIQNTTYYFVKKFIVFPEFKDVPSFLESFGMHTNFNKACEIALVNDEEIRIQLLNGTGHSARQAKVIDLNDSNFTVQKVSGL